MLCDNCSVYNRYNSCVVQGPPSGRYVCIVYLSGNGESVHKLIYENKRVLKLPAKREIYNKFIYILYRRFYNRC